MHVIIYPYKEQIKMFKFRLVETILEILFLQNPNKEEEKTLHTEIVIII